MNPIDRLVGLEAVKKAVEAEHKQAKLDAEDYYCEMERQGIKSLGSTVFGDAGGEFKRGMTRAKEAVWFEVDDWKQFDSWLDENRPMVLKYVFDNFAPFCEHWFSETGEVPNGIKRRVRKDPATPTGPKLYKFDQQGVLDVLMEHGGLFEGANRLLVGDSE